VSVLKQLRERDAKRHEGAELLQSVREVKAGNGKVVAQIAVPEVVPARMSSDLSQSEFAQLLGVSVRTVQDLQQSCRTPSGEAQTLIAIAQQQPKALKTNAQGPSCRSKMMGINSARTRSRS
jgi:putative transcriptional regulator